MALVGLIMDIRKSNEDKIKKFIAGALKNKVRDVYSSDGKPSPSKLVKQLKIETGISITRQTMAKYLKEDLSSYMIDVDFSQNIKIREIKEAMRIAKGIYENSIAKPSDKTKAMNAWRQLNQQLIDYEQHLRELALRKIEASRPNYLISFEPACAGYTCSKCGYSCYIQWDKEKERWIEVKEKAKEKEKYFKSGDGQGTLYDGDNKNDK